VQAVDETAESTQKWEGADAAAAADAQANVQGANAEEANVSGRVVEQPPQNLCVTVASRIPEMLAESMALAGDDAPPTPKR